jgi:hypothetical protein
MCGWKIYVIFGISYFASPVLALLLNTSHSFTLLRIIWPGLYSTLYLGVRICTYLYNMFNYILFANIKPIGKTIPPLWFLKTIENPKRKSANALKL